MVGQVDAWGERGGKSCGDGKNRILVYDGLYWSQSNMECELTSPQHRHFLSFLHCLATWSVSRQLEQKRSPVVRCSHVCVVWPGI